MSDHLGDRMVLAIRRAPIGGVAGSRPAGGLDGDRR